MAVVAGASFVGGVVFLIVGAWPVIGFFGLDVVLVYWAFRANYLAAAAYEEVTVTPSELRVKKVSHRGEVAEWSLNPVWVRIERETHPEYRPAAAVSGLARPQARGCGLSRAGRKGHVRRRAFRRDR